MTYVFLDGVSLTPQALQEMTRVLKDPAFYDWDHELAMVLDTFKDNFVIMFTNNPYTAARIEGILNKHQIDNFVSLARRPILDVEDLQGFIDPEEDEFEPDEGFVCDLDDDLDLEEEDEEDEETD